ncbi:hypothetical protein P3T76_012572 [Phytophthora citrophthora]|uniref:Uncharacterized protein n=1 Tax=Phytophthora citrophthora TaxID=4793 RepID=A0AAD9G4X6_9STRA|nr:hypothetical protein P3T76_012572 [Phytophthora citrophthora]
MKVEGTFLRMRTLAQMTRAALKIWQFVAKYTTKPLLCQGVEGDMAMAKNSRRKSFADASIPVKNGINNEDHIAFDDMCKLIKPDKTAIYTPPTSQRVQVVALANWESAPTFVLDDYTGNGHSKASTDRLFNKCNPFLSGKRRANSEDLTSEAPTVSTDCSTIPEYEIGELDIVAEETDNMEEEKPSVMEEGTSETKVEPNVKESEESLTNEPKSDILAPKSAVEPKKQTAQWACVGHGSWVKAGEEESPKIRSSSNRKTENPWKVRWVQIGYGRYSKYYINEETGEEIAV